MNSYPGTTPLFVPDVMAVGTGTMRPLGFTWQQLQQIFWRVKQYSVNLDVTVVGADGYNQNDNWTLATTPRQLLQQAILGNFGENTTGPGIALNSDNGNITMLQFGLFNPYLTLYNYPPPLDGVDSSDGVDWVQVLQVNAMMTGKTWNATTIAQVDGLFYPAMWATSNPASESYMRTTQLGFWDGGSVGAGTFQTLPANLGFTFDATTGEIDVDGADDSGNTLDAQIVPTEWFDYGGIFNPSTGQLAA